MYIVINALRVIGDKNKANREERGRRWEENETEREGQTGKERRCVCLCVCVCVSERERESVCVKELNPHHT